ncbi:MAG: NAD(P)-dependent oxidoreductase [bacterium]|nr:NAD(P)-dependent oxidoreductase [bacterium]
MKAYSIFDDFPASSVEILERSGIEVTLLPKGMERPEGEALKRLLNEYDVLIISTAQKMPEEIFEDINEPKIIATASIGIDHVHIPEGKKSFIKLVNAPKANRISVAEHTFGLILALKKQLNEARRIAAEGKSKKVMQYKPNDLYGSTIGVIGAGGTAGAVLDMAKAFGMKRMAWTRNPENHENLADDGVEFTELDYLLKNADIISVNLPMTDETNGLISADKIELIKENAVFITVSRTEITDNEALLKRASVQKNLFVGMDIDADKVCGLWDDDMDNVIVTPHIAGGTVESRVRLFDEVSHAVISVI